MNISVALMMLLTTGVCTDGEQCILDNVDITASLYHAGAIDANLDYQEYILNKFDGKLSLAEASLHNASFRRLQLKFILMCKEDSHYKASPSIVTKGNDGRVF
jgi:hypothetical protein